MSLQFKYTLILVISIIIPQNHSIERTVDSVEKIFFKPSLNHRPIQAIWTKEYLDHIDHFSPQSNNSLFYDNPKRYINLILHRSFHSGISYEAKYCEPW